jgi:uncharacterized protein YkwD
MARRRRTRGLLCVLAVTASLSAGRVAAAGPAAASTPSVATAAADAQQVFALINTERRWHGLPALRWNARLTSAAHAHNLRMAKANLLSHQLTGETWFGGRITAAGYRWRAIAENIGETSDWSLAGILSVHRGMYRELAPNNIHRRTILSTTYRDVGIDIVMDPVHLRAWITEDFAAPL